VILGSRRAGKLAGVIAPAVVKPARSVIQVNGKQAKLAVTQTHDEKELNSILETLPAEAYPLLIQERVEGEGVGVFVLLHENRLLAAFAHRRIREKPPSGGVSVLRESVELDPKLLEMSLSLLRHFEWSGPAMVEYKVDATGTPYIMEINGRFWGSLQLAVDAGVDFPALFVAASMGEPREPVTSYRVGVRSRWFFGDVDHLILRLKNASGELGLPRSAPSRLRTSLDFLTSFLPGSRSEILRINDPLPAVREMFDWFTFRD
jgi:predicted ATP-grasp superfamily ATP-dependent carboligase